MTTQRKIRFTDVINMNGIVMAFLLLASMNTINRYYYFIFIAFALFLIIPGKKIVFDPSVISLLMLAIAWAIFAPAALNSFWGPLKPLTYALAYLMGASFVNFRTIRDGKVYKSFYWVIATIAAGPFIHFLLNWIKNGNAEDRNTIDIWTNSVKAATGQAALACIPLGLAIACLLSRSSKWLKILSAAVIALILGYNLVLAGRTLVALFSIVFVIGAVYLLKASKGKRLQILAIIAVVMILLIFAYQSNVLGVRDMIESSSLYNRFWGDNASMELDEDGRSEKRAYFIANADRFLFGGAHLRDEMGYAHDILLDTYDEAGIFALIAIVAYLVSAIIRLFKCITNKTLPFEFRQIVLCVYAVVCIEFFIEPILQGMPWLFASFCLIDGYVGRILSTERANWRSNLNAHC